MLAALEAPASFLPDAVKRATRSGRLRSDTAAHTARVTPGLTLHLRPCAAIVSTVGKYRAEVTVKKGSQSASAASVLELLSLAAAPDTELVLTATGPEAQEALDAVQELLAGDFPGT